MILVDQNFDVGGKMLHSGSQVSLGGGDPLQLRDIKGESDKEGIIKAPPVQKPDELTEDTDAIVLVVSEETGRMSLVVGGEIHEDLDGPNLRRALLVLTGDGHGVDEESAPGLEPSQARM